MDVKKNGFGGCGGRRPLRQRMTEVRQDGRSLWRVFGNEEYDCFTALAFVVSVGTPDPKAISNSSDLFTLIATDTSEWRSFQVLRCMACRE